MNIGEVGQVWPNVVREPVISVKGRLVACIMLGPRVLVSAEAFGIGGTGALEAGGIRIAGVLSLVQEPSDDCVGA